jgi:transposase
MGQIRRGADGRRTFTTEFKKAQIARVLGGEITQAELVRELDVSPSVVGKWKRLFEHGSEIAVQANGDVVPAQQLREAERRIRELERALGRYRLQVHALSAASLVERPSAGLVERLVELPGRQCMIL